MIQLADADDDGHVDYDEFAKMMMKARARSGLPHSFALASWPWHWYPCACVVRCLCGR